MEPPFDPSVPLLSLCLEELKSAYYSDAATSIFIASQFTIAKLWNQTGCPSTDEWIKKMWYIFMKEYYLVLKKNEMMTFAGKWIEMENIMQSKVSQSQRTKD